MKVYLIYHNERTPVIKFTHLFVFVTLIFILLSCASTAPNRTVNYTLHKKSNDLDFMTHEIPVYVDKLFTDYEDKEIAKAIKAWNYSLNGYKYYYIADLNFDMNPYVTQSVNDTGNGLIILKIDSNNFMFQQMKFDKHVIAFVPKLGASYIYIIEDRMTANPGMINYQNVIMHEMGHTLGAMHITNYPDNLMFPVVNGMLCVDEKTARQVAENYNYNLENMNYCYFTK